MTRRRAAPDLEAGATAVARVAPTGGAFRQGPALRCEAVALVRRALRIGALAVAFTAAACSGRGATPTASASAPAPAPSPAPAPEPPPAPPPGSMSATFLPTDADFPNPGRGFYGSAGDDFITAFDPAGMSSAYASGRRLVSASVSLAAYRTRDLDPGFLSTLAEHLAAVRAAGMKATLVFAYDFSAAGLDTDSAWIARHLAQLQPVLAANADVIAYMRAGFIGAWGEWHSSQSGNSCDERSSTTSCATADANRIVVRDALLRAVPATTQVGFRYPADLQRWYPGGDAPAQVGVDDDCFLAGPTDSGTYPDPGQRAYVQALTRKTSFGGETCEGVGTPVRGSCADILSEGALYHLAWLNGDYAPAVLQGWKDAGCYDRVAALMGYRIQLDRVSNAPGVARGDTLAVAVDLRNVGWARMFAPRPLVVTLRHRATGATLAAGAGDLAALPPQATASTRITVQVPIPADAATGGYDILVSAPDTFPATRGDVRFSVRFANADQPAIGQAWNPAGGTLASGTSVAVE